MLIWILIVFDQMMKYYFSSDPILNTGLLYGVMSFKIMNSIILCISIILLLIYIFCIERVAYLDFFFAGLASNAIDRLCYGGVVDIFYLPYLAWFNLADIYMWVFTVIFYIIHHFKRDIDI